MKIRNLKGQFIFTGGRESTRRDKACLECERLIMRRSTWCRKCSQKGSRSIHWKINNIQYSGLHKRIRTKWGMKQECAFCGSKNEGQREYQWANINGQYNFDPRNWVRLCLSCHRKYDKRRGGDRHELQFYRS